jgi:hypothetical protein
MGKRTQSTPRTTFLFQHVHAQTSFEDKWVVQQLNNVVALVALITKWTDHMVVGDKCTTTVSLQELVFTWHWGIPRGWPTPVEAMMEHATALRVMGIWFVLAPLGLECCKVQLLTRETTQFGIDVILLYLLVSPRSNGSACLTECTGHARITEDQNARENLK